jgi:hypothetical protein
MLSTIRQVHVFCYMWKLDLKKIMNRKIFRGYWREETNRK